VDQLPLLKSSSNWERTVAAFLLLTCPPFENPNGGTNLIEILAMFYTWFVSAMKSKLGYFSGWCLSSL